MEIARDQVTRITFTKQSCSQEKRERSACLINTADTDHRLVEIPQSILKHQISQEDDQSTQKKRCITASCFISTSCIREVSQVNGVNTLDLSNMKLPDTACLESFNLDNLKILNLSNNKIFSTSFNLKIPPLLEELNVSHNEFHFLPTVITNSCLVKIDLSYNCFDKIPKDLPNSLRVLNLAANEIENLKDVELPSALFSLNISHNKIKEIPIKAMCIFVQLDTLDISHNCLKNEIFVVDKNDRLSRLDISGNGIIQSKIIISKEMVVYF